MKRHVALQDLSREHHHALKLALDCRRAAAAQDAAQQNAMIAACSACFASELEPHFQIEERDLLPRLAAAGETALVERTLAEHAAIRQLVAALPQRGAGGLEEFAVLMNAHVRFEERQLFAALEKLLPA